MKTIVIFEDDIADLIIISSIINNIDDTITVQHYTDPRKGIEEFAEKHPGNWPTMVFMDIMMPYMNGFEVTEALRSLSIRSPLPIVMFSTSNNKADIEKSYQCGANAYVAKSHNLEVMRERIKDTISFWLHTNMV